jgi:hypothetical protein
MCGVPPGPRPAGELITVAGRGATRSIHRPAVDSPEILLPPARVGGATTIQSATRSTDTRRQIASFATIGVLSTIAYVLLYAAFRAVLGRTVSNALALVITSVANTGANRRLTFGVRRPSAARRGPRRGPRGIRPGAWPHDRIGDAARHGRAVGRPRRGARRSRGFERPRDRGPLHAAPVVDGRARITLRRVTWNAHPTTSLASSGDARIPISGLLPSPR